MSYIGIFWFCLQLDKNYRNFRRTGHVSDIILLFSSLFRQWCFCNVWLSRRKCWCKHKYKNKVFLSVPAEAKNICRSFVSAGTIESKALAKITVHENDGVFCEMSTVTAVSRKRLLALPCVSAWSKVTATFFIKITKNNRDIKLADTLQIYFILGISNFDRLCFLK
jgi:hypothetical protein